MKEIVMNFLGKGKTPSAMSCMFYFFADHGLLIFVLLLHSISCSIEHFIAPT